LWIVLSMTTNNVAPDVVRQMAGNVFRMQQASDHVARSILKRCCEQHMVAAGCAPVEVTSTLTEGEYVPVFERCVALLKTDEPGRVVAVFERAKRIALRRVLQQSSMRVITPSSSLPSVQDVLDARLALMGQPQVSAAHTAGSSAAAAASSSMAGSLAAKINGGFRPPD
jgi:hypothetical protein